MTGIKDLKRASFTVEAAVIVPLTFFMLALLLGFGYYTHQSVWCCSVGGEAALYSLQRFADGSEPDEKARERAGQRLDEAPLIMGSTQQSASLSKTRISLSWEADILPDVFGELYMLSGNVSAVRLDPVTLKQSRWIIGDLIDEE